MSGFARRSFSQRYHSLGAELNVAGRPLRHRMIRRFDAQHRGGRTPGVADVRTGAEKLVVVPVPVLRVLRRGQRKAGEVESHPRAAALHVLPEGLTLRGIIGPRIEEQHDLVAREKLGVELGPVGRRLVAERCCLAGFGKPAVGLAHEADVGEIVRASIERETLNCEGPSCTPAVVARIVSTIDYCRTRVATRTTDGHHADESTRKQRLKA